MYRETLDFQCQHSLAGKSFNGKFTAKIDFPIGYFMLALHADAEDLKSLHILFDLDHMLV